ncbi:hypothetical protein [Cryobacterium sp. Y50]|uniref:hypothetical protein n=1 Tax=Cryobacterium sp. Y50 TaxID=2048286 RepID=UPI0011B04653|nr:hypothetical protein [Cryobacterium sp. Y50]
MIEAYVASHGRRPNPVTIIKLRAQATLSTRPAKQVHSLAEISWRAPFSSVNTLRPVDPDVGEVFHRPKLRLRSPQFVEPAEEEMVAIIALSAEEYLLAFSGEIPEPGFRPYPGSNRDRELDSELEAEEAMIDGDDEFEGSAVATETKPALRRFTRLSAARHWKESSQEIVVLLSRDSKNILGFGSAKGRRRGAERGTRNVEFCVRRTLAQPIKLESVLNRMPDRDRSILQQALGGITRPLPPKSSQRFQDALFEEFEEARQITATIRKQLNDEVVRAHLSRQPRETELPQEAAGTALRFFSAAWQNLAPVPYSEPSAFITRLDSVVPELEDDVITDDAAVFPGWQRATSSSRGWWEFRDSDRRLFIKNINVSPQETTTGADLVYIKRDPDTFVLVQYKLMEQLANNRLVYRPDGRLVSQVDRMLALEVEGSGSATDLDDYRISSGFTFVKFVAPRLARRDRAGELVPGHYLPSAFVRIMLGKPDVGPSRGIVHYIAERRSIKPDTFARLVRGNWIGSTGEATALLRETFGLIESQNLIVAVDEPADDAAR